MSTLSNQAIVCRSASKLTDRSPPPCLSSPSALAPGGPAGLVALKTLKENGLHAVLFEAEDDIGGTFK